MNTFAELQHWLSSKSKVRSLFRHVTSKDMEKTIKRLTEVLKEKLQAELDRKGKKKSIKKISKTMARLGLSITDLGSFVEMEKPKQNRKVEKHNFEYQDFAGNTVYYYGSLRGRLPKDFRKYLERTNKKRAECIVESGS